MTYSIPNLGSNHFDIAPLNLQVFISGVHSTDCYCEGFTTSGGNGFGSANLIFPQCGYTDNPCLENDLIELKVSGSVVWRGFITKREADLSSQVKYMAVDLLAKFDDSFFWEHEYCFQDEVTKSPQFVCTIRQIAGDAYDLYQAWKSGNCDDDFLLGIDLDTFPEVYPVETRLVGQPLLQGLKTLLETVDYRYRLTVKHTNTESIISAYIMGAGTQKSINRGTDPNQDYYSQTGGPAFVTDIRKTVDSTQCLTHVYAEGDHRIIESAFPLGESWNLCADNFTPPTGSNINSFVKMTEMKKVLNNWEKFTKENIELKSIDKFNVKAVNPNYRKKYERVCTHFAIPPINDTYHYLDDCNTYPQAFGTASKHVKIESDLVQTYDGHTVAPFIVAQRSSNTDTNLYITSDGFSIKDSQEVVFSKPFVDSISNVYAKGTHGVYHADSWDESTFTSELEIYHDYTPNDWDLTDTTKQGWITSSEGVWLILGETMQAYRITETMTNATVKVFGDLRDAGIDDGSGGKKKGTHWFIWKSDATPFLVAAQNGEGHEQGRYRISSTGSDELINNYAGAYLVIGAYDFTKNAWGDSPSNVKLFRIAYNSEKDLWIDSAGTDLSDTTKYGAKYAIVWAPIETKRPYKRMWLNAAYKSGQRLTWMSPNLGTVRNKRIVPKKNDDMKWLTMRNYFKLKKSGEDETGDLFTPVYCNTSSDMVCNLTELSSWALNQINGAKAYQVEYDITLGFIDLDLSVGDRIVDTAIDSGATITSIAYNPLDNSMNISASSWA